MHTESHALAGKVVTVPDYFGDDDIHFEVEDWWDLLTGGSWQDAEGNPAALQYAMHSLNIPMDDEVVYGHAVGNGLGYLYHVSELGDVVS